LKINKTLTKEKNQKIKTKKIESETLITIKIKVDFLGYEREQTSHLLMPWATNKGRGYGGESNETVKAHFTPPGDATRTAQSAQCLLCADTC